LLFELNHKIITVKKNIVIMKFFSKWIPDNLSDLWGHLNHRRRTQFFLLLALMLVSAFLDIISIGAVLPFLGVLTAPEQLLEYPLMSSVIQFFNIESADQLILPITAVFGLAALVAGMFRLLLVWANIRFSNGCGADLSVELYRRTLYQPYSVHLSRNSSEVLSGVAKVASAQNVLHALMTLVSSTVLIISIIIVLIVINTNMAIIAAITFSISYGIIAKLSRWRLERNSEHVAIEQTQMIKAVQEGLGGIRDILLDGTQSIYCGIYRSSQLSMMRALSSNQFITASPRYIMESISMVLIAGLAFWLSKQDGGIVAAIPVLGALALGAQRLLPAIQQLYSGWAGIKGNEASLADALKLLEQPLPADLNHPEPAPLNFKQSIRFINVRFQYYENGPWVLNGLDLTIPKGSRIGFVGTTGSGKTTTLDILMGLLVPISGQILVDDISIISKQRRAWQKNIAHVPQAIYLADSTLAENIAFGVPLELVNMDRVQMAASQAQIDKFIEDQPKGYKSFVGERGIRLSGGQRQRIGIARALYKNASVLIFDEATSALDNTTEQAVVDSIENLNRELTILLIAHRLSTVRHCDIIFELENGRIISQGTYQELIERSGTLS
jgi:ABC-type multidrug transport system fused ATPase/permease subunit